LISLFPPSSLGQLAVLLLEESLGLQALLLPAEVVAVFQLSDGLPGSSHQRPQHEEAAGADGDHHQTGKSEQIGPHQSGGDEHPAACAQTEDAADTVVGPFHPFVLEVLREAHAEFYKSVVRHGSHVCARGLHRSSVEDGGPTLQRLDAAPGCAPGRGSAGRLVITGVRLQAAAILLALFGPVALLITGPVGLLSAMDLLGVAVFLAFVPPSDGTFGRVEPDAVTLRRGLLALRLGTGGVLITLAFAEKLANPALARGDRPPVSPSWTYSSWSASTCRSIRPSPSPEPPNCCSGCW
jgi:hypothetical protein